MPDTTLPPEAALMQMIFGKAVTQAISVMARFRIAHSLGECPEIRRG